MQIKHAAVGLTRAGQCRADHQPCLIGQALHMYKCASHLRMPQTQRTAASTQTRANTYTV